jgi:hypothetical protein
VVVGDFLVESGQGLLLWRGVGPGRGSDIASPAIRTARGIVPYLSSGEDAFFRGAGAHWEAGPVSLLGFASVRSLAGAIDGTVVTSLPRGGLFRTTLERSRRGAVTERIVGTLIGIHPSDSWQLGLAGYRGWFSRPLALETGARFTGSTIDAASLHWIVEEGPWSCFGEWGVAAGAHGGSAGARFRPSRRFSLVVSAHRYAARFASFHGRGLGPAGTVAGESGFYGALRVVPSRSWSVSAYLEREWSAPDGTLRFPAGSSGSFVELTARPGGRFLVTARYGEHRSEERELRTLGGLASRWPAEEIHRAVRLTLEARPASGLRVRTRAEWARAESGRSNGRSDGAMGFQEVSGDAGGALRWNVRVVFVRASAVRFTIAEPGLAGVTSTATLSGRGLRWSALVQWTFRPGTALSARYAAGFRDDVRRIGTGADRLPANRDGVWELQADLAW